MLQHVNAADNQDQRLIIHISSTLYEAERKILDINACWWRWLRTSTIIIMFSSTNSQENIVFDEPSRLIHLQWTCSLFFSHLITFLPLILSLSKSSPGHFSLIFSVLSTLITNHLYIPLLARLYLIDWWIFWSSDLRIWVF